MIEYKKGNLLETDAEALVNTVNCVGVMGKGIALQFKQAFPENFIEYQKACRLEEIKPGKMFTVPTNKLLNPKFIINFPTKTHWKGKSKLEYIESGLNSLIYEIKRLGIQSIAVPPLGCGNGGLNWDDVRTLIVNAFAELPEVTVYLFAPEGSPDPDTIKIATKKPAFTRSRALFLSLMDNYAAPGYSLSLLEIQKLAYFLQNTGEPLRLNFTKNLYGPYAENLNFVLQRLDGHYIRGYGDRSRTIKIVLMPYAAKEARDYLANEKGALNHLDHVSKIIRGFETPYGLELLATVHWIIKEKPDINSKIDEIINTVHKWSKRKRELFKATHIKIAWQHLNSLNLFNDTVTI